MNPLWLIILLLILSVIKADKGQMGGRGRKVKGKGRGRKAKGKGPRTRQTSQHSGGWSDPYAWIRPWIIIDFFRKFWLTR